jgi:phosphoglycerate kinase
LENLKFEFGEISKETKEKKAFVKNLASLTDIYVNEAFGVDESLSSMSTLSGMIKDKALGFHYIEEVEALKKYKFKNYKNTTLIYGGLVNEKKLGMISNALKNFKNVLVGGEISLVLNKLKDDFDAKEVLSKVSKAKNLQLPKSYSNGKKVLNLKEIKDIEELTDIGSDDVNNFKNIITQSDLIVWIGSLSTKESIYSAEEIGAHINLNTSKECIKIISGDNLSKELSDANIVLKKFNHVSIDGVELLSRLLSK